MPNSRQTSVIDSPSSNFATNRRRSSITEHSFHGIDTSRSKAESVTHVSGTFCHLCLGPLTCFTTAWEMFGVRMPPARALARWWFSLFTGVDQLPQFGRGSARLSLLGYWGYRSCGDVG